MSPIIEAMKPSPNSDRQSCASSGELFPKNGTAFATESPTTFVSSRPTIFGSSRRPGITGKITGNFPESGDRSAVFAYNQCAIQSLTAEFPREPNSKFSAVITLWGTHALHGDL